jgi:hypothetical protein
VSTSDVRERECGVSADGMLAVSMRGMLAEYISSNETQVYRCASQQSYRSFAPPFAVAFSQGQSCLCATARGNEADWFNVDRCTSGGETVVGGCG